MRLEYLVQLVEPYQDKGSLPQLEVQYFKNCSWIAEVHWHSLTGSIWFHVDNEFHLLEHEQWAEAKKLYIIKPYSNKYEDIISSKAIMVWEFWSE